MTTPQPPHSITLRLSQVRKGDNPRRYFDRKKHDDLVSSIRLRGVLQPILVRPSRDDEDAFSIVAGERRYRASLEAFGPDGVIPATIREMTDQEALEAAIDENDERDDVSETEQADAAVRVLAACRNDRAEAAARLGWSRAKLDRRLALAELSTAVKCALDERRIKIGHAELLAAVPADKQDKALETILRANLDVAKTRDLLMRVTQSLATACFDKTECTTCPFNSGAQRALFETHIDDGHCTNPGCFELKTQAVEAIRFEEQERAAKASARSASVATTGDDDGDTVASYDEPDLPKAPGNADHVAAAGALGAGLSAPRSKSSSPVGQKPAVTVESIARRTSELREATWRTALARSLAANTAHAHIAILVAAMSGTLSQIKADTLRARAGLLVDAAFPSLEYHAKIAAIQALPETQAATIHAAIGAAYAKDVLDFGHVADLARTFEVDLRDVWHVDQAFLERYTREELSFIARECGLVGHVGEKAFAKLLAAKKADLIKGMLNRIGFDWAGRLPSAMTLDGRYDPPPVRMSPQDDTRLPEMAA